MACPLKTLSVQIRAGLIQHAGKTKMPNDSKRRWLWLYRLAQPKEITT